MGDITGQPRIYADANLPSGIVEFMRVRLQWDVLFVMEHEELRRARDIEHYRLARQLGERSHTRSRLHRRSTVPSRRRRRRDRPVGTDETRLRWLLKQADRRFFRAEGAGPLPLEGRKIHWPEDASA